MGVSLKRLIWNNVQKRHCVKIPSNQTVSFENARWLKIITHDFYVNNKFPHEVYPLIICCVIFQT